MIYEEPTTDNSNVALEQSANNQHSPNSATGPGAKIATSTDSSNEIPLTSEDLLKLSDHHHEASNSIVTTGNVLKGSLRLLGCF